MPRVMGLGEVLNEWLAHRREVLVRRSEHRLAAIRHRLEVLDGYLIAYLNLDEVIRIIRAEDEPKPVLMKRFKLTDVQAEAILNMRLRSLRKLEEMEIRGEHDKLTKEQNALEALVKSEDKQWEAIADEIREVRKTFGPDTPLGRRRTTFAEAPEHDVEDIQTAMVEREPITVVVSEKGWIRALKGHVTDTERPRSSRPTTRSNSRFPPRPPTRSWSPRPAAASTRSRPTSCPAGAAMASRSRLMVDMDAAEDVVAVFVHNPERKLLVVSTEGRGFVVPEAEILANTRKGKQVMGVDAPEEMRLCVAASGDRSPSSARTESSSSSRSTRCPR